MSLSTKAMLACLSADATSAIQETQAALKHLDEGKTKERRAGTATGKLDIILARNPKLELPAAGVGVASA